MKYSNEKNILEDISTNGNCSQSQIDFSNKNWKTVKIKNVSKEITVGFVGTMEKYFVDSGIPLLRGQNVRPSLLNLTNLKFIPKTIHEKWEKSQLHPGDVILVRVGFPGTACVVPENLGIANCASLVIVRVNKELIDPNYLVRALNSSWGRGKIKSFLVGSSQQVLNAKLTAELEIPLPPLPVQRQIVAVLEQAEAVKQQRQEADALTGALLQSVFREMFGEPEMNERGWERKTLADVCVKFEHGLYVPKERYVENNGVEMIHMADAFYGEVKPGNLRQISATDKESKKYQLLENDLLVARRSLTFEGAAKACKLPKNFGKLLFESSLIRVRPDETCIDPEYLYQYLNNPTIRRKYVFPFVTSSTISGINQENLKKITVLLPPLALQQQFARIVENVERIRKQQVASGRQIEGLCEGLMQRAFAGELVA